MVRSTRPDRTMRRRSGAALVMAGCLLSATSCSSGSGSSASNTSAGGGGGATTSGVAATSQASKAAPSSGGATSTSTGPSEPAAPSTSKTKVSLSMVVQPFAFKNFSAVVNLYKTVNPNVTINLTQGGASSAEYIQGISTARLGGKVPDIFETFDVISDQEALEVDAHGGPKRAIHFEQQSIRGGDSENGVVSKSGACWKEINVCLLAIAKLVG